ncbi:EGF-like domain-containing protein [Heterostelium album PN500]|uniref:EGF-like domain-containing protein n=1 Tax=Heterostelium pallidum (strain ATCC 26659 / Pp 5 / PN500) TaxID=670386 RepID=D3B899_HETP5|nr:EGF-like domain-containing protein [Heterostelium album PN500]EFA82267.1 EGF-like domain-containing protein [Heterostelium album PN500]|eukprot:XP_020434384.1 EGF-like domain-containing protein [Heterostelium album PN500]
MVWQSLACNRLPAEFLLTLVGSDSSYTNAKVDCESRTKNSLKGLKHRYLFTVNTRQEFEFIATSDPDFVSQNSFWIAAASSSDDRNGPEAGMVFYEAQNERCSGYCLWGNGEPYYSTSLEYYVHYDKNRKSWNNNENSFIRLPYVCEYGNLDDIIPLSAPTTGGQVVFTIPISITFYDNDIFKINMTKLSNPSIVMSCTNPVPSYSKGTVVCDVPAGTGIWNVTLTKNDVQYASSLYSYQRPLVQFIIPDFVKNEVLIYGLNFGNEMYAKPSFTFKDSRSNCTNVVKMYDGSYKCTLPSLTSFDILLPLTVEVDKLNSTFFKVPTSYESGRFISYWHTLSTYDEAVQITRNMSINGIYSTLTYFNTKAEQDFTAIVFPYTNMDIPDLGVWTSLYCNSTLSIVSLYGADVGKELFPYSQYAPTFNLAAPYIFVYSFGNQTLLPTLQPNRNTEHNFIYEYYVKAPNYAANLTHTLGTQGGLVNVYLQELMTPGYRYFTLNGQSYPITSNPENPVYSIQIPAGYGGPYPLVVGVVSSLGNVTTTSTSNYVAYLTPNLNSISPSSVPTSGGIVVLTGSNLYNNESMIRVYFNGVSLPVTFKTPHTQVAVVIPPGAGFSTTYIRFNGINTGSVPFGYTAPLITNSSTIFAIGGPITITGENFYIDPALIFVWIDGVNCDSVKILEVDQTISCISRPTNKNIVDIVVAANYSSSAPFSKAVSEPKNPLVLVASQGQKNRQTLITIFGNYFFGDNLTITIGGEKCDQPTFINSTTLTCLFAGNAPQPDIYQPLFVNVTSNDLSGGAFVFNYKQDKACEIVCKHGTCDTETGTCRCEAGWTDMGCGTPTTPGGKPTENNGTTVNPANVNFTSAITHLREVGPTGLIIKTVPLSTIIWARNNVTGEYTGTFKNETVVIRMNVTIYENPTVVNFAGQDIYIQSNSSKFVVHLTNWTFSERLNDLQVIFLSKTDESIENGCKRIQTESTSVDDQYQIVAGDSVLQAKFASYLFIDNRIVRSRRFVLGEEDPIVVENKKPGVYALATAVVISYFEKDATFDPSFNSLLTSNYGSGECKDDNWKMIVIIVCTVVPGVAIIAALSIYLRKRYKKKQYLKDMNRKLKALN